MSEFCDYIADVLGTRQWVVSQSLTASLRSRGYDCAVSPSRYTEIKVEFERKTHKEALALAARYEKEYGVSLLAALGAAYER